jgi:hypothetical protein
MQIAQLSRRQVSGLLFWLGFSLVVGIGTGQLLKDGSFWLDEAAVALSFLELSPSEFIGRLSGGQNFPRLVLLLIAQLEGLFGFRTLVLRFLPYLFFIAATALWLRLFRLRFGALPLLLCLALVLNMVPTSWLAYSAMLKQYTFDVFVALVPFSVSDAFFEQSLRRGRRLWRPLLLTLFCAMSYTYAVALLARVAGWYLGGLSAGGQRGLRRGLSQGRYRLNARAVCAFVCGVLVCSLSLWFTDLRHTLKQDFVFDFWGKCILAQVWGDWDSAITLLNRFAFGWYEGAQEFALARRLPLAALAILKISFCLGLVRIAWSVFGRRAAISPELEEWGSRSVGCLLCVLALLAASAVIGYPVCAGRLTLFASCCMQIVLLEGLSLVYVGLRRLRYGPAVATAFLVLTIALLVPTAVRNTGRVIQSDVPQNIRPLARRMRERSDLPVLVLPCMRKQVETLPEGLGVASVEYLDFEDDWASRVPSGGQAWVLDVRYGWGFCRAALPAIRNLATDVERFHTLEDTANLFLATFPPRHEGGSPSQLPSATRSLNP